MESEGSVVANVTPAFITLPDQQIEDLIPNRSYERFQTSSVKTEKLRTIADAFIYNMRRVDQLSEMPLAIASMASERNGETTYKSCGTKTFKYRAGNLLGTSTEKYVTINNVWWLSPYIDDEELLRRQVYKAVGLVRILTVAGRGAGVQGWLSSVLLGTWTAFETLAGDLWVEAINIHPHILSE